MSKAVLVLDMPENCTECPLSIDVENHKGKNWGNLFSGFEEYSFNMDPVKKPDWCPLREIKKCELDKMRQESIESDCYDGTDEIDKAYLLGKIVGWNTCINAIAGDAK